MATVDYRNQTTIITGASAGLGVQFARQLAARGSNLVLVARRADRLETLATELRVAHGVTVTVVPLDLTTADAAAELHAQLDALGVSPTGLVNNAGFGTFARFHTEDHARIADEIALNIQSLVALTREFIEPLRASGSGILINVASTAAYQPVPNMAVYAATKAFVLSFTEALWYESLPTGLKVLALSPGATQTEFFDVVGTEGAKVGSFQTAEHVVGLAIRALDRRTPPSSIVCGTGNRLNVFGLRFVPRGAVVRIAAAAMKTSHRTEVRSAHA